MADATTLVLGGGIGGLTLATQLRRLTPDDHRIVVIEREQRFAAGLSKLWVMTGERADRSEGERSLADLAALGIEVVEAEVTAIDPSARTVETSAGTFEGDYLCVALGAKRDADAVPGFAEAAHNLYEWDGAEDIQRALQDFTGGRLVILIARTPYSCPAAPYEAAFMIDSLLRERGVRDQTELALYTPEDRPMLVAGEHIGTALIEMLEERGIELHWEQIAMKIDPAASRILFELHDTTFDLLVGVPPHVVPPVLKEAGLADASGWVPVDAQTLATRFERVFAIGDATAIRLANGMYLPKAGVFADAQGRVVATAIAAELTGDGESTVFSGRGECYVELGGGLAAHAGGDFYGLPAPSVAMDPPSASYRREKEDVERELLALWP